MPHRSLINAGSLMVALLLIGAAPMAWAEAPAETPPPETVCPICSHTNRSASPYYAKAGSTLVRGATNTFLGWTELLRQPAEEAKSRGNVLTGMGNGVRLGVSRTLQGLGEVLTFWTPRMNDQYLHFSTDCPICMGKTNDPS